MTGSKWVIAWFLEGFGFGWLSEKPPGVLPWTGEIEHAVTFGSKEAADRYLVQLVFQEEYWPEMEVEELTKENTPV